MINLYYVLFYLYLLLVGCLLFAEVFDYTLQSVYAYIQIALTILVMSGAILPIRYSRLPQNRKFGLLALLGGAAIATLILVGGMLMESKFFVSCEEHYTSPSRQRAIAIKDVCLFDCDSYLYLQSFIFEKNVAKIVDDGAGYCNSRRYSNAHLQWSADERQIEWKIDGNQGVVRLE